VAVPLPLRAVMGSVRTVTAYKVHAVGGVTWWDSGRPRAGGGSPSRRGVTQKKTLTVPRSSRNKEMAFWSGVPGDQFGWFRNCVRLLELR
jgi:hypothetical protein